MWYSFENSVKFFLNWGKFYVKNYIKFSLKSIFFCKLRQIFLKIEWNSL